MASLHDDLHNEQLFEENKPGDYRYEENEYGKSAEGYLVHEKGERDLQAQREAGGEERLEDDDGGHLIATANKGSKGPENIDAQNKNLNRGSYKIHENELNEEIDKGSKVYEHVETFKSDGHERPDAYMGYSIIEHPDGSRDWDAFSYTNASSQEQEQWNQFIDEMDMDDEDLATQSSMDDDYEEEGSMNGDLQEDSLEDESSSNDNDMDV